MIRIFLKKKCPRYPVDNGPSLNIQIIALTNITLIDICISSLSITCLFDLSSSSLICTSCDVSKICLPPMHFPIECSPNDQIPPKLSVSINSTDIYISSSKFVLNKSISMEVRFNTFPARSRSFYVLISKYITGTDRPYCLTQPSNARYAVKYHFFA
jgi:hypothetical protein